MSRQANLIKGIPVKTTEKKFSLVPASNAKETVPDQSSYSVFSYSNDVLPNRKPKYK